MGERKYRICLSAPLGERSGTMTLCESGGRIDGWLEVMKQKNRLSGTLSDGGRVELSGRLRTLVSTVPYTATGTVSGSRILLNLKTASGAYYPVSGEELKADEEIL